MGHALEGVVSVKGVEAILAEGGRTTLDLKTVHGTSEVPSSLGLSRVDSGSTVIPSTQAPLLPGSGGKTVPWTHQHHSPVSHKNIWLVFGSYLYA